MVKHATSLRRRAAQRQWPKASQVRCEQTIMLGFYAIRKLIESSKLTQDVIDERIDIICYKAVGESAIHLFNMHRIDEHYTLDDGSEKTASLIDLCNQVIHSFIFMLCFDEEYRLCSILVSSDRKKEAELWEVPINSIIDRFQRVGEDNANFMECGRYNKDKKRWDIKLRYKPPQEP